jgi:RNA recognition motif-containing protein
MELYVGNIPYSCTEANLRELFEKFGPVDNVHLLIERETGQFRGKAFIEMSDAGGQAAIEGLRDKNFLGRKLVVNEAHPKG